MQKKDYPSAYFIEQYPSLCLVKLLFVCFSVATFFFPHPCYAFKDLPVSSFDSKASLAWKGFNVDDRYYQRSGWDYYVAFTPISKYGFIFEGTQVKLQVQDRDYLKPAGNKDRLKRNYSRHTLGLRSLFYDYDQSVAKLGMQLEVSVNNSADQDGESYGATPFIYIGNHLPFSLRFAYSTEFSRKNTRFSDADLATFDKLYASHLYLRFDPYNSVVRFPFGYEYYQREGTTPDIQYFDTDNEQQIQHKLFYYLFNEIQMTLSYRQSKIAKNVQNSPNGNQESSYISLGFELPLQ